MSYGLKLGLEVHAQLLAGHKLFSRTVPKFHAVPNSQVSFFDAALPGTQPQLSPACLRLALRAGLALNSAIPNRFSFDRKHYMYPDQPAGYQITQFREPVAKNGYLDLFPRDLPQHVQKKGKQASLKAEVDAVKRIRISQIQMEQDTGKTSYIDSLSLVDLNRANTGLIELVTMPDFRSEMEAVAFIRKLQLTLRKLGVCSGEMETGAMRVDVNVSVMDNETGADLGDRCEIKNLFSTSAVKHAIRAEFRRQVEAIRSGKLIEKETRGWDGKRTWKLRDKESALDYRYMPDPDIPAYFLPDRVVAGVRRGLPELPDRVLDKLLGTGASLVDAKTLLDLDGGAEYALALCEQLEPRLGPLGLKMVSTWLVHRWLGQHADRFPDPTQFGDLLVAVHENRISSTTAKLIIKHMAQGYAGSIDAIINEFGLESPPASDSESSELLETCEEVVRAHPDVVAKIQAGKKQSLGFLLGQVMKETQGTFDPKQIRETLAGLVARK